MRLLAFLFLILLSTSVFGQGSNAARRLQLQFDQAVATDDPSSAFRTFHELFALDSNQAWPLASGLAELIDDDAPRPGLLDSLVILYRIGGRQSPGSAVDFSQKQAFLAFRFPAHFDLEKPLWLKQAIDLNPFQCALQLYRFWGDGLEAGQMRNRIRLAAVAEDWAAFDRYLYARELLFPSEAEATHRVRTRIHHQLASLIPDCEGIRKTLKVSSENSQLFQALVLSSLQRCRNEAVWIRFERDLSSGAPAWAHRLLADHYLNIGQPDKCLATLKLAISQEELPILKADLHAQSARLLVDQGNYRAARAQVQTAISLVPAWGDLYLTMADIYLEGSKACNFNDFDSKAVYWLAIDLAQKAINSSPHLQQEANRRIFEYRLQMPEAKEIEFRGLSAGDTWPLKCWMNTVTTVKEN